MAGVLLVERVAEISIDGGLPKLGVLCSHRFARNVFTRLTVKRTRDGGMRFEIVIPRGIVMLSKVGSDQSERSWVSVLANVNERQGAR